MDKSQFLKYLQEVWEELDTADTDFYLSIVAINGFDINLSDLVLDARQIRGELSVVIENLSHLICKHESEEELA